MGVAGFLGAGLAGENGYERRIALHELLQAGEDFADFVEAVEAVGAAAELAGGLWAAQEQDADQRGFGAGEVEGFAEPMLVFSDAAIGAAGSASKTVVFKTAQGEADFLVIEAHDWLAVAGLVTGVEQGVQGERIVVRGGDFLFDKSAENAGLGGRKNDGLGDGHRLISTLRREGSSGQSSACPLQ